VKKARNLEAPLPDKDISGLWEEANDSVGKLLAGLLGRHRWDDDVHALHEELYDELCSNGFEVNLYNALTIPLGVFPHNGGWTDHARWVWDLDAFRGVADDFRAMLLEEGWTPPPDESSA
jgi:hypothetical protein